MFEAYQVAQRKDLRARKVFTISAIITGVLFAATIAMAIMNLDIIGPIIMISCSLGFWATIGTGIWYWRAKPESLKAPNLVDYELRGTDGKVYAAFQAEGTTAALATMKPQLPGNPWVLVRLADPWDGPARFFTPDSYCLDCGCVMWRTLD